MAAPVRDRYTVRKIFTTRWQSEIFVRKIITKKAKIGKFPGIPFRQESTRVPRNPCCARENSLCCCLAKAIDTARVTSLELIRCPSEMIGLP